MKYTENYNLKKPEPTDSYNVEDFNRNMDILDKFLKVEDISSEFMTHNVSDTLCKADLIMVYKQGNVISGQVVITGSMLEASGDDLIWTINSKYKPKQGTVICQCMGIGEYDMQPNAEISCFIGDDQLEIGQCGNHDYKGIVISFSYIC